MFTDSQTGDTQIITYPNTPISAKDSHSANVEEFQGDFARLIPANRLARIAYSEVIEKSLRLPQWNEHAQKFLYFEEARDDEDHLSELSDADTTAVLARQRCRWSGYYRLNLSILPQYIGLGWILGSGSVSFPEAGVDLLLTAERSQHRIGSRHTRFSFHRGTGCLLVFADRRNVSLRGSFGQVELRNAHRALTESAGITIGDLQYSFEYTGLNQERYREELTSLMKQKLGQPEFEISSSLSTSGSDTDIQLKDYTVKQVFASGISCTVATAIVKKTGEAVAVKKLKKSDTNYDAVMCEVNILQRIEQHPRICHLRETIQNKRSGFSLRNVDEILLIYEPLLIHTLEELIVSDRLDDLARVNICEQCIEGLAWIHKCGIMHRDIKPLNMGMKSISPPEAMIFDFGHGTAKQTSTDHYKGTIAYLAPEVLDLKFHKSDIPYNNAADVWAMGISAYQMMCRKKWRGLNMVKDEQKRICDYTLDRLVTARDDLQRCAQAQVASVIQKMLMETPSERIFAEDALAALMELDAGKTDRKLASKLKHTRDPIEMMEERTQPPASLMLRTSSLLSPSLPIA